VGGIGLDGRTSGDAVAARLTEKMRFNRKIGDKRIASRRPLRLILPGGELPPPLDAMAWARNTIRLQEREREREGRGRKETRDEEGGMGSVNRRREEGEWRERGRRFPPIDEGRGCWAVLGMGRAADTFKFITE
jgi:hypothetical protein